MPYDMTGRLIPQSTATQMVRESYVKNSMAFRSSAVQLTPPLLMPVEQLLGSRTLNRILIIRNAGLGDVLCITPTVRYLSQIYGVEIHIKTEYPQLFENNPYVSKTFRMHEHTPLEEYDGHVDLGGYVERHENTVQHRPTAFGASLGINLPSVHLDYFPSPEELRAAASRLSDYPYTGKPGPIAYILRSSTSNRNWALDTHTKVLAKLSSASLGIIILDPEKQQIPLSRIYSGIVNLTGKTSIRELAAIMARCSVVITPDTGLFHMAQALRKPTLAYFGAFPIEERATTHYTLLNEPSTCPAFPCHGYTCPFSERREGLEPQSECLEVNPDTVLRRVLEARATCTTHSPS